VYLATKTWFVEVNC